MNKTKIDWATATWNPVTGCLHGCEYCYASGIAKRFGTRKNAYWEKDGGYIRHYNGVDMPILDSPIMFMAESEDGEGCSGFTIGVNPYPVGFTPTFHRYRLGEPAREKTPQNIFACSMADLFGEWVPDEWIRRVFDACAAAPQHTYMFLTKNPQRYNDLIGAHILPTADNFWYGGTRTGKDSDREHEASMSGHTFLSIEPIHGPIGDATMGALELWDCGAEKQYRLVKDGVNCENFSSREETMDSECIHKTTDGYCELHSDGAKYRDPCVEGPCDDEHLSTQKGEIGQ